ncbi:MAG TPA: peptidylprolyl isomerase [Clostridia bacterium]|nr:peptidylprolyl isomerase [Clostridia bacterium]
MNNKRLWALILVLGLALSIVGCASASKDNKNGTVVAKVNGEKITKGEFDEIYDQIKQSYYITEEAENDPEQQEMIKELKTGVLEQLISEKIMVQKAKEAGFVVDEGTLDWARIEFESIISEIALQMEDIDAEQGEEVQEDRDYTNEARAYIEEELEGIGKTQEEYLDIMAKQKVVDDYLESQAEDIQASEDEIKAFYDEKLESQKQDISTIAYEEVELFKPLEARVKHILIPLPREETDEYVSMLTEGDEDGAKVFLDGKLEAIESKAKEVLEKANNDEDFEELIEEYGEDPGMIANAEGYMVRQDGGFVPEFEEMAFKLKEGEISDLVGTAHGYHIIKFYGNSAEKIYTLEEKHDEIKQILDEEKKADAWMVMMEDWKNEAKVKRYEKRL